MKNKLPEYIPLRDVKLVLWHSVLWFLALGIFGYPGDERLGIVLIAYLALWTSRLIVTTLVRLVTERLHKVVLRAVGQERFDQFIEDSVSNPSAGFSVGLIVFVLAVAAVILGASFVAIPPVAGYFGYSSFKLSA